MPTKVKPEYEVFKEFKVLAEKLIARHPTVLDGISVANLTCYAITNIEPKDGKEPFSIKAVDYPLRLEVPFDYFVTINKQAWDEMNKKHQLAMVMRILFAIDREEPGKILPPDLKDFSVLNRTLGPDYLMNSEIPDLLEDKVDWKFVQTSEIKE